MPQRLQKIILRAYFRNNFVSEGVSCDALYSVIGFTGKLFVQCPSSKVCLWIATGHCYGKKRGCSSDSLPYRRKHSADRGRATGVSR